MLCEHTKLLHSNSLRSTYHSSRKLCCRIERWSESKPIRQRSWRPLLSAVFFPPILGARGWIAAGVSERVKEVYRTLHTRFSHCLLIRHRVTIVRVMEDESDDDEDIDNDDPWANDEWFPDFLKFPSEIALRDARRTNYVQNWLANRA
jgi:hypothetical protein